MAGPDKPRLVCVDPRDTDVARHAEVHLALKPGTNLALMHGLVRELFVNGWIDEDYIRRHTMNVEELRSTVEPWTPQEVARTCGVDAQDVRRAAEIFGTSERVLSTVLQGFYQSSQATASSCAVNNLHLLRGLIGKPGSGILQMNGQPTAQNNRECGADGDLSGFRNWENPQHVQELAQLWNVDPATIPHWRRPPTPCRSSATWSRLHPVPVGFGHQPGRVTARTAPHPRHPGQSGPVPGGAGLVPDRNRAVRRRGAAGGRVG
ncbi:molybdopterin-dependent oxidoreductase [Arthrobacter sp. JCM 19049]|uniref:molybdopterin-dependent oxidoreductase n=1 Tax=Arthrobacter sp. JCM 19049 TaxID=1460643 RepID=UPI0035B50579